MESSNGSRREPEALTVQDITRALSEPRTISGRQHLINTFNLSPLIADEWIRRQRSWVGQRQSVAKRSQQPPSRTVRA